MNTNIAYIFLDANTALHFKRPDQINWCALTGAAEVILVSSPIFTRELEKQKVQNPSRKLKDRAGEYIKWLAKYVRDPSIEVRPSVRWYFIPSEPKLNFEEHGLSQIIADDHLIASVLTYTPEPKGSIYVATDDIGLEIKLRHRQITPLQLKDEVRLPVESDPQEKELQELRRQLSQKHMAELNLKFKGGDQHETITVSPPKKTEEPSLEDIMAQHPLQPIPAQAPKKLPANTTLDLAQRLAMENFHLQPEYIEKKNENLRQYYKEHQNYLDELSIWTEQMLLTFEVNLVVSNDGTAPASDVDIILEFPEDLILIEKGNPANKPEAPSAPYQNHLSMFDPYRPDMRSLNLFHPSMDRLVRDGIAHINTGHNEISFTVRNLKHHFVRNLETFYFRFPDRKKIKSFKASYHLSAAELPEPTTGLLHFVIAEDQAPTTDQF